MPRKIFSKLKAFTATVAQTALRCGGLIFAAVLAACSVPASPPQTDQNALDANARSLEARLLAQYPLEVPNLGIEGRLDRLELDAVYVFGSGLRMGEVVFGGRPFYQLEISQELIEEIPVIDQTHLRYAYSVRLKSDFGERVIARSRSEFLCVERDYAAIVQYPPICNDLRTDKLLEALVGL